MCVQEVAELKEEELSSDTAEEVSATANDPSSILSESHSTHMYTRAVQYDSGILLYS